jgi:hypothetical protein
MVIGILKTKHEVRPPSNRIIVMLKEATPMATCLSCRTDASYIQRFCLTHLDHLRKIIRLWFGLLRWTLQWQLFPNKCWVTRDSSRRNHGVRLYRNQTPQPIKDWHAIFLQATKWATFPESRASLCSSTLIWPRGVVGCRCRHPQYCLHSWCVNVAYCATYCLNIFPITLPNSKESRIVGESQRDSFASLRLNRYMLPACTCPI